MIGPFWSRGPKALETRNTGKITTVISPVGCKFRYLVNFWFPGPEVAKIKIYAILMLESYSTYPISSPDMISFNISNTFSLSCISHTLRNSLITFVLSASLKN